MSKPQQERQGDEEVEDFGNAVVDISFNQIKVTGSPRLATEAMWLLMKRIEALETGYELAPTDGGKQEKPPTERRVDIENESIERGDQGLSRSKKRHAEAKTAGAELSYEERFALQRERIGRAIDPWVVRIRGAVGKSCSWLLNVTKIKGAIDIVLSWL